MVIKHTQAAITESKHKDMSQEYYATVSHSDNCCYWTVRKITRSIFSFWELIKHDGELIIS